MTGQRVAVEFTLTEEPAAVAEAVARAGRSPHQRLLEVAKHPMVHRAAELFGAQPLRVEETGD